MMVAVWSSVRGLDLDARVARLEARFGRAGHIERRGDGAIFQWSASGRWRKERDGLVCGHADNSSWVRWGEPDGITCGRGAVGGEPLYAGRDSRGALVASSLEALLVALEERVELDYAQTDSVVASLPPIDPRATPYRGVQRLLSLERAALGSRPEPTPEAGCGEPLENLEGSDDELAEALWKAAYEAVARSARGVHVLGVLAGGGVDSSGLLAAAVAHAKDRGDLQIVPLAIDFAARGDDRPHLRAAAAWLGVEPVRIPPEDAAPYLRASLIVDARPSLEATLPLLVAAAVAGKARGVEVIITGFLGDLILDAPAGATLARARAAGPVETLRAVIAAGRHRDPFATSSSRLVWHAVVAPLLSRVAPRSLLHARRRRAYAAPMPWAGPRLHRFFERCAEQFPARAPLGTAAERFAALCANAQMLEQIETRAQVEHLAGVRFSEPWMDAEFCRTVARVPPWRLWAGHRDRGLFRHALRGRIPDRVRLRPDKAMMEPALDRMLAAAGGEGAFGDLLEARRLVAHGFVDRAALDKVIQPFFARRPEEDGGDTWTTLWSVAAAEAFLASHDR
jgi:asparagine synthetase B (glutamine-hydrolysing)